MPSPISLAVGDFNRDGKLDVAVIAVGSQLVSVMLGVGDGTFGAPVSYTATSGAIALTTADLDRDGNLDLIVGGNAGVAILFGKGNGTFWGPAIYGISSVAVQVADIDGDGKLDLVVTTGFSDPKVSVLKGRGYGTFDPATEYSLGAYPTGLAIADFNGDGSMDLAVTNTLGVNSISVLLNEPVIALFPAALTFPAQKVGTTSNPQTATVSNPGASVLRLNSILVSGANASDFVATTACGKRLVPANDCAVTITFDPSAKGMRAANLKITDNALGRVQFIQLHGTGQ